MQIKINIDAQHLTLSSNKIVSGTNNFVECSFTFSADWGELEKWALFKREHNTYEMYIEDNKCVIPSQCISAQGEIIMSVIGRSDGKNITATAEDKLLVIAGRAFGGEDENRLTTTYLEETLGLVQNIRGQVADSTNVAAQKAQQAAASAEAAESSARRSERAAAGVQSINDQLDRAEALATQTKENADAAKKAAAQAQRNAEASDEAVTQTQQNADAAAEYATQAQQNAEAASQSTIDAAESAKGAASSRDSARLSERNAASSETLSQKWAEGTLPGGEGTYSAKEFAEQAGEQRAAADTSAANAAESATQAAASADAAAQSALDAQTAVTEAVLTAAGVTIKDGKFCYVYYKEVEQ